MKEYNIVRHFQTKNSEKYSRLVVYFRNDKPKELKFELNYQQSVKTWNTKTVFMLITC